VLAADGRRWLNLDPGMTFDKLDRWVDLTKLEDHGLGEGQHHLESSTNPAPPRTAKRMFRGKDKGCTWGSASGGRGGNPMHDYAPKIPAGVLGSIRGTVARPPAATESALRFFRDGLCATDAAGKCDYKKPPTRAPSALWFKRVPNSRPTRLVTLPSGCRQPFAIEVIHGLGLLRCAEAGKTVVYSAVEPEPDATGVIPAPQLRPDGVLDVEPADINGFGVAADGTILAVARCESGDCDAWLRSRNGGWKKITVAGGAAYRVLRGGRAVALVARAETDDRGRVAFVVVGRGAQKVLVDGVSIPHRVTGFEIDPRRRVKLRLVRRDGSSYTALVGSKGRLIPVDGSGG
jgi:hypothetical protein